MYKSIVGDGDDCYVEADDDQGSNREICNKWESDAIKNFTAVEYSKEE